MTPVVRRVASLVLCGLLIAGTPVSPASADPTPEGRATWLINSAREKHGLNRLRRDARLDRVAEQHSIRMRRAGNIFHRNDLSAGIPNPWKMVGENVGVNSTVKRLHVALMKSPGHRANILRRRFDRVGIGIVRDKRGRIYETQIFVDR